MGGRIGFVLALAALAAVCVGFVHTHQAKADYGEAGLGEDGLTFLRAARSTLAVGAALSVVALALGTTGVVGAEANHHRPSMWARGAACLSVLTTGACGGLLLALLVMALQLDRRKAEVTYSDTLSGWSYVFLAFTLLLVVGGLLVCFYLALKAAGGEEAAQLPEDMAQTGND